MNSSPPHISEFCLPGGRGRVHKTTINNQHKRDSRAPLYLPRSNPPPWSPPPPHPPPSTLDQFGLGGFGPSDLFNLTYHAPGLSAVGGGGGREVSQLADSQLAAFPQRQNLTSSTANWLGSSWQLFFPPPHPSHHRPPCHDLPLPQWVRSERPWPRPRLLPWFHPPGPGQRRSPLVEVGLFSLRWWWL